MNMANQEKQKKPKTEIINLGALSKKYEKGVAAIAAASGVPSESVKLGGLTEILNKAEADIAAALGIPVEKLKVEVNLAA